MITIESQGDWKLTRNWFDRMTKLDLALIMNQFGKEGFLLSRRRPPPGRARQQLAGTTKSQELARTGRSPGQTHT